MKSIVSALIVCVLMTTGCTEKKQQTITSKNFELIELSDGVYACIHKIGGKAICNAGFVDNGMETIVFDCFLSPTVAEEMVTAIETLGLSPVRYVVNSHAHNDHIRGNQVFGPDVRIISTTRTAELIAEWEPEELAAEKEYAPGRLAHYDSLFHAFEGDTTSREYLDILMWKPYFEVLSASSREVITRLPDMLIDSSISLDGPSRNVRLLTSGAGHTESDLAMYLPDDSVLFTADLVFNECHPYMADGSVKGLKEWLRYLNTLPVETVVPGHGPLGKQSAIPVMLSYVEELESLAGHMLETGQEPGESSTELIPQRYEGWWFERFFSSNLRFTYREMNEIRSR